MKLVGHLNLKSVFLVVLMSNMESVVSSTKVSNSSIAVLGERIEMKCRTRSGSALWKYTPWQMSENKDIYLGVDIVAAFMSRYKVDKNITGQHILIIDSVDFSYAGRYECVEPPDNIVWNDVQLTVSGSHPLCAANTTEDRTEQLRLTMWCSLNYTGKEIPVFSWTKNNEQFNITAKTIIYPVPSSKISSITTHLQPKDIEVTFRCRITFQMQHNSTKDARNAYKYIWNYTLYGPINLSIVKYEDRLECSADGNPTPIYKWTNLKINLSTDGPVYLLNGTNRSESTLECTATNIFASENKNYTIKVDKCKVKDPGGTQDPAAERPGGLDIFVTALVIGGSLLLLLITAVIIACVACRKRLKDDASARPDVALQTCTGFTAKKSGADNIADNAVYAQVMKPKGPSKGNKGGNIGDSSRPHNSRKDVTGADGTVYAELSGVKPPTRKGAAQVPKTPAFNKVEIYASIDHSGKATPPPLPPK